MTLDQAIDRYTNNAEYERIHGSLQGCLDFRQLAEWLKDYKRLLEQQPCDDTVSRQAVLDVINLNWDYRKNCIRAIDDLPSTTPQQKSGKWIKQTLSVKPFGEDTVLCDQCAFMTDKDSMYNYCPNCGAKMVEPQKSEDKK